MVSLLSNFLTTRAWVAVLLAAAAVTACEIPEDGRNDRFERSDDGTGPESNPAVARGVARLLNQVGLQKLTSKQACAPSAGASCLPGVGIQRNAAEGIIAARPFDFDREDPLAVL